MKPNKAALELLNLLRKDKPSDIIPPGFFSARQLADMMGRSASFIREKLYDEIKCGTVERRNFLVKYGNTRRSIPHYKKI